MSFVVDGFSGPPWPRGLFGVTTPHVSPQDPNPQPSSDGTLRNLKRKIVSVVNEDVVSTDISLNRNSHVPEAKPTANSSIKHGHKISMGKLVPLPLHLANKQYRKPKQLSIDNFTFSK